MIVFELYNDSMNIQFATEQEADNYIIEIGIQIESLNNQIVQINAQISALDNTADNYLQTLNALNNAKQNRETELAYWQSQPINKRQIEIQPTPPAPPTLKKSDWDNFDQTMYRHPTVFQKVFMSEGNGFAFLSRVLSDGKTTYASEQALLSAINSLVLPVPFTEEEKQFINDALRDNNFTIRVE